VTSSHFSSEGQGTPTARGRYVDVRDVSPVEFVPGLEFGPVVGEKTMTNFVRFEPHTEAPRHSHEEEHIVIVLDGEFEFDLDGDVRTMRPGDVAAVPPWVPRGAHTLDSPCYEVDVFNPPRRTLLDHAAARIGQLAVAGAGSSQAGQHSARFRVPGR